MGGLLVFMIALLTLDTLMGLWIAITKGLPQWSWSGLWGRYKSCTTETLHLCRRATQKSNRSNPSWPTSVGLFPYFSFSQSMVGGFALYETMLPTVRKDLQVVKGEVDGLVYEWDLQDSWPIHFSKVRKSAELSRFWKQWRSPAHLGELVRI